MHLFSLIRPVKNKQKNRNIYFKKEDNGESKTQTFSACNKLQMFVVERPCLERKREKVLLILKL